VNGRSDGRSDDNNKARLAAALAVYDGYKPLMQEISDLYERGDFYTADPMQTELNDDLAEVAGKLAEAARDLLAEDPTHKGDPGCRLP
jgi:hypothetical protein